MSRILSIALVLLLAIAAYFAFGFFQAGNVYAFFPSTQSGEGPFAFSFNGIPLRVESDSTDSACLPTHTITLEGEDPVVLASGFFGGSLISATVCDLDADGQLELALVSRSCGSGGYLELLLWEREGEAWSELIRGPLPGKNGVGYRGYGEITFGPTNILHRYPLYADGDSNVSSTGGERLVEYHLFENSLLEFASIENRTKSKD